MSPGASPSERIRSIRQARSLIDLAAIHIARDPDAWVTFVNNTRTRLGHEPLFAEDADTSTVDFIQSEVGEAAAAYPAKRLRALDSGGMNSVLRSWELFTGRELTVRRHLPAKSAIEEFQRLHREGIVRERMTTLPRHPCVPRYWASGMVDGRMCEVYDFAPGISLKKYVAEHGLSYGAFLDFALRAAGAVRHLHRHGLIHADIKPENFCVEARIRASGEGSLRVSLIDFDMVCSPEDQMKQYRLGDALEGTVPYMPPENFGMWVPEDPGEAERMMYSKDVFALGLTMYRILAGRFPDSLYADVTEIVVRKQSMEELVLDLPGTLPTDLDALIRSMCRAHWRLRPDMSEVFQRLRALRDLSTPEERAFVCVAPEVQVELTAPRKTPFVERVGPYQVVTRTFAERPLGDTQRLPLAELSDFFGRRLIGVPYAFDSEEGQRAFYQERCAVLMDLNRVRLLNADLFHGSFRDLVQEEKNGKYMVWIVRPLLEGAVDLRRFLAEERAGSAPLGERMTILRRVAEALSVLDDAGYRHPSISCETVFFVPIPLDGDPAASGSTKPVTPLTDLYMGRANRPFRQELMGTAFVRKKGDASEPDPAVTSFINVANEIDLFVELSDKEKDQLLSIRNVPTWRQRASIVAELESSIY